MAVISTIIFVFLINYGNCSPASLSSLFDSDVINVKKAVNYLNSIEGRTWTAGANDFGEYLTLSQQVNRMGSLTLQDIVNKINVNGHTIPTSIDWNLTKEDNHATSAGENHVYSYDDLPEYYDARKMYPHCTTISSIRQQSKCGCCWAASTAAVFSDRLCIHSKGLINVNISMNHLMTCAKSPGVHGCHGGWENEAWDFIRDHGVVSGGDYESFDGCQPFSIKPCGRQDQMPCELAEEIMTPICRQNKCSNEWHEPEGELYKAKYTWRMLGNFTRPNNEMDIRREIYRNGPVSASFLVYPSFTLYKSGIFQTKSEGVPLGGHSVRIIGWGTENGIPYWTLANSWGKYWGEGGFFRMLRGRNTCFIESNINCGIPDIPLDVN